MPEDEEDMPRRLNLPSEERRVDDPLWLTLPPVQREELSLLMQGRSSGAVLVDLGILEGNHEVQLWQSLTYAQRAQLELLQRGESTGGFTLDLDRLEESLGSP
jgi:hypothetical protein